VKTTIETMLDQLAELQSALDLITMYKADLIDGIMTPEIKAQIAAVDLEYAPILEVARTKISDIETAVKAAVIEHGATVKGTWAQVVFAKGRVSWDTKALDGYAVGQPALLAFRTEGSPSVSIRTVKG